MSQPSTVTSDKASTKTWLSSRLEKIKGVFSRFPVTIVALFFWTLIVGISVWAAYFGFNENQIYRLFTIVIGLSSWLILSIGNTILIESLGKIQSKFLSFFLHVISFLISASATFLLPNNNSDYQFAQQLVTASLISISLIWGVFSWTFVWANKHINYDLQPVKQDLIIWQWLWSLFLNFTVSMIFNFAITLAISIIPISLGIFFQIESRYEVAPTIALFVASLIAIPFFLSEIPHLQDIIRQFQPNLNKSEDINKKSSSTFRYPRLLNFVLPYVGLPIISVYLGILTVFGLNIIIQQNWPNSGLAIQMLSLLIPLIILVYALEPIRRSNTLINRWCMGLLIISIPSFLIFCNAIYIRVIEYGITPNRYFLIIIATISFAGIIASLLPIRRFAVPIYTSVLLLILLSSPTFGLIDSTVFSLSKRILDRLSSIGVYQNNIIRPIEKINNEDSRILSNQFLALEQIKKLDSITQYLDTDGKNALTKFQTSNKNSNLLDQNTPKTNPEFNSAFSQDEWLIEYLGGVYSPYSEERTGDTQATYYFSINSQNPYNISNDFQKDRNNSYISNVRLSAVERFNKRINQQNILNCSLSVVNREFLVCSIINSDNSLTEGRSESILQKINQNDFSSNYNQANISIDEPITVTLTISNLDIKLIIESLQLEYNQPKNQVKTIDYIDGVIIINAKDE